MENYIYIVGEQQSTVLVEESQILEFTASKMSEINTEELYLVVGNVFGKGEFFPGPQEVVTSIIHELVRRWNEEDSLPEGNRCSIITSFMLVTGDIKTMTLASFTTDDWDLSLDKEDGFYSFLLEKLPQVQDKLANDAYAPNSRLVSIIKDCAAHHKEQ
jgi:hypothetical protein